MLGLIVVAGFGLSAPNALAHAYLQSSSPAANSTVVPPSVIADPLEARFSGFQIADTKIGRSMRHPMLMARN